MRINRVSPPNRLAFEPVLTFKNQKVPSSTKNRLTPLKRRPEEKPSLMDKDKAKKLIMLAKVIKDL